MEDWRIFVDQHNTEQFKRVSARNKVNRAKLKGPACLGRRSMAVTRHQMAMERNLTSDAEIGRGDVYLRAHTSKDKVVQYPDLVQKLDELYSSNPASKMTGVDDALTQICQSQNDMSKVLGDQSFLSSILASLPGVNPNDPSVKDLLASLQGQTEQKKDEDKPPNEDEK
ncbi:26S proteasome non-ATPase regulatory subunit 4 homolog [Magnolia sinica]|uniref:26S proteasome non-ATPase regulatory subunit 4 homolog n=1 Tax=Magnolia sinica TaxID=86752 RepID=UPI002657D98A|nr:26S proteasome non-ATPase regulatory subunit 4 homolog [Magnolia sinica]